MAPPARKKRSSKPRPPSSPRVRRTPEEARLRILDAAEARLRDGGPEAIRLQDIAADVGISHPTILHHFESRDGLTRALGLRITERLVADLVDALSKEPATEASAESMIELVFATMNDTGTARLIAWRALSFESSREALPLLETITTLLHDRRVAHARENGLVAPSREDSAFIARLASGAALGDALSGDIWTQGSKEARATDARFRRWFAHLLMEHLGEGDEP